MKALTFLTLLLCWHCIRGQDTSRLESQLRQTSSEALKVRMIDTVAYIYMLYGSKDSLGEEYGRRALRIAENAGDKQLLAEALYLNARRSWWDGLNKAWRNERFLFYNNELIRVSRVENLPYYEAAANILLAGFHAIHYEYDAALPKLQYALLVATELKNDSLIAVIHARTGEMYSQKMEKIMAFKHFMLALRLSEKLSSRAAEGFVRQSIGGFYKHIGDLPKAIENLKLAKQHYFHTRKRDFETLFWLNIELADSYINIRQADKAEHLYNEILEWRIDQPVPEPLLNNAHLNKYQLMYNQGRYEEAEHYLQANPGILKLLDNWKYTYGHYLFTAERHKKENNLDSAEYYYTNYILPTIDQEKVDARILSPMYDDFGEILLMKKDYRKAIDIYKLAADLSKSTSNIKQLRNAYASLHTAYAGLSEFKEAYFYQDLYHRINDSIANIENEQQLTILEIENENKRQQAIELAEAERIRARHNLQYMGITFAIALMFSLLIALGVFTTSAPVIKAIGFLAFIMLFEFIILIADNYIHRVTHGEPWKVMAIKICIIAFLFPFHHYIENKIVSLLIRQKKISLRAPFLGTKKVQDTVDHKS